MIKVFPDHQQVVLSYRADVENLLQPHAKRFELHGEWYLAVPHTIEAVRLLRNLDLQVESPINYYYDWGNGSPFESQRITADLLSVSPRAYVLSEMGVGKTRATLYAYSYLRQSLQVNSALVVAPLSTLVSVWENEIFENFSHLRTVVLYGDKKKRLKLLNTPADVYVINHDGVEVIHPELFARNDIDTIIVDELACFRNRRSARWKNLAPIVQRSQYAWGLTGSPTPNEPTDAYGQVKLLTPENIGWSFKAFRDKTMRQVSAFKFIARDEANDVVREAMQPSVRFTREQCFDLPETTYSNRLVEMSPNAAKTYKKMFDDLAVQVRSKEITAANEGVKLGKLLQIAAGFAYDSDGNGNFIGGVERFREVFEIVESAGGKVIVFAPFRYLTELLATTLSKKYDVGMIHGDVPKAERDRIFMSFQKSTTPRVLVAHPGTMAHGLTLTAANTIVWAAPVTSLEIYEQANARITRSGQKLQTHIIHIMSTDAEKRVYSRLRRKAKMQGALLGLFEEATT